MKLKIVLAAMVLFAFAMGGLLYYLQIYAYYDEVSAETAGDVKLTSIHTGQPEVIAYDNFEGIDSTTSPIRFRACFTTSASFGMLTETYETYDAAEPLVAPGWFNCFDAEEIGEALETGEALAFLGEENITYGIDRIVAVMPDGRGFVWHQINHCGDVVFHGDKAPDDCPAPPQGIN